MYVCVMICYGMNCDDTVHMLYCTMVHLKMLVGAKFMYIIYIYIYIYIYRIFSTWDRHFDDASCSDDTILEKRTYGTSHR